MTQEEGNKLIAEFMGGKFNRLDDGLGHISKVMYFLPGNNPNPHCSAGTYKNIPELDYHKRWDWLMPVVEKIENKENLPFTDLSTDIKSVWQAVVETIQWYNQNPQ